jgi:tRNA (cmo5U34)-methyltransferase
MHDHPDANAEIWRSEAIVECWVVEAEAEERHRVAQRRMMADLLPFGDEPVTFLDLGAGTGAASRAILARHPRSSAVLADFSAQMMRAGEPQMAQFAGRYRTVEFDMLGSAWPEEIPEQFDAIVTSMCVHHLPDERKRSLFAEAFGRLVPGGWYLNYDPVAAPDQAIEQAWERVADREDPEAAIKRQRWTPEQHARWQNHVRYVIPLDRQLGYLREAGFAGIDVYWKKLENVIYGGYRPA